MLKRIISANILAVFFIIIASCGQKKQVDISHMIPADAEHIMAIQIDKIGQKMDFNTLAKQNEESFGRIRILMAFMGIPDLLEDRSILGVDFKSPVYMYYNFDKKDGMSFNALLKLEDVEKFEGFLEKLKPTEKSVENGISSMNLNFGTISWKNRIAWISMGVDVDSDEMNPFLLSPEKSLAETDLGKMIATADISDFAMWTNPMSTAGKLKELAPGLHAENFLDYIATMSLNFEKGHIECNYRINAHGETAKNFDILVDKGIDPGLLTGLDSSEIPGLLTFAVNPEMIKYIFLNSGFENAILQFDHHDDNDDEKNDESEAKEKAERIKRGLNLISKALRGDAVIAFKGLEKENDTSSFHPVFYFATGIQNRKPIDSILNKWIADTMLVAKEGYYETAKPGNAMYIIVEASKFIIVNSTSERDAILNKETQSEISEGIVEKVTRMPSYIMVDFDLLNKNLNELMTEKDMGSMGMLSTGLMSVVGSFERLEMTSKKESPEVYSATFILTMKDKDQNSMAYIFKKAMDLTSSFGM